MRFIHATLVFLASCFVPFHQVNAETYAGARLGIVFGQQLTGLTGDENVNYPDLPIPGSLFTGSGITDLDLKNSLDGGLKLGHYFNGLPEFGLELEGDFSHADFRRQNVTLSNPGFAAIPVVGQGSVTEDQLPAHIQHWMFAVNAMYRYRGLGDITPYVGAGPALNVFKITGTGFSGIIVDPNPVAVCAGGAGLCAGPGPSINETVTALGLNLKAGVEYRIAESWGLGVEYHYNWTPVTIDNFRSISNANGDFQSHSVGVTLAKHF